MSSTMFSMDAKSDTNRMSVLSFTRGSLSWSSAEVQTNKCCEPFCVNMVDARGSTRTCDSNYGVVLLIREGPVRSHVRNYVSRMPLRPQHIHKLNTHSLLQALPNQQRTNMTFFVPLALSQRLKKCHGIKLSVDDRINNASRNCVQNSVVLFRRPVAVQRKKFAGSCLQVLHRSRPTW